MTGTTGSSSGDLTRLIASAQATTQAINNLNQTLNTSNVSLSSLATSISAFIVDIPGVPNGATVICAGGGPSVSTTATATLTPTSGTMWITGYDIGYTGATAATALAVTINGLSQTLYLPFAVPAGTDTTAGQFVYKFPTPIPAATAGTAISVVMEAVPGGSAYANAFGFYL